MMPDGIQTPCFIVDYDSIVNDINDLKIQMSNRWSSFVIGYSFKTNNVPEIIAIMKKQGLYAEVVSDDEYELAIQLGFRKDKIIFNGPIKSEARFIDAVMNGSIVNIDAKRELDWLKVLDNSSLSKAKIGLRVNFNLEQYCPGESQCGSNDGRFGFSFETGELEEAIGFLLKNHIPLKGLHMHTSSKTRSVNVYKTLASVACQVINKYHLDLDYLDFGGGFFGKMPGKPSFGDYFDAIKAVLNDNNISQSITIIVEPGMAIIGKNVSYVCEVIDCKKTLNNRFAVTNGSRTHIDPLQKKTSYFYSLIRKTDTDLKGQKTTLCGYTCMESDRFFDTTLSIDTSDLVIFDRVGAYTIGLSPLFIQFYPVFYLKKGNKYTILKKKMTAKDFVAIGGRL